MLKKKINSPSAQLAEIAIHGIQEKKGNDIVSLDLRNIDSAVSDYFIICNADSGVQVRAISDNIEKEIFENLNLEPWKKEGFEHGEWIILDYLDVVIHIFKTEKRTFYSLEDLWGDAVSKHYQIAQ